MDKQFEHELDNLCDHLELHGLNNLCERLKKYEKWLELQVEAFASTPVSNEYIRVLEQFKRTMKN
jgi:hypothetical protein